MSQLDRQVAFQHHELLVPRLIGLETNLKLNRVVWASIKKALPSFSEGRGCFTQAIEDYLSAPFLTTYLDNQAIATLLQECRIIDTINQRYLAGPRIKEDLREREVKTMRNLIEKADTRALATLSSVERCLTTFRPVSG